jgi:hypothetical protein
VKGALFARNSLHYQARTLIDQNAQDGFSFIGKLNKTKAKYSTQPM